MNQINYQNLSVKQLVKLANDNDELAQEETIKRYMIYGRNYSIEEYIRLEKWDNFLEKCQEDQRYVVLALNTKFIDHKLLLPIVKQKAKQGDSLAQNNLGFIYTYSNDKVPKSFKWLKRAADLGSVFAFCNLSYNYNDMAIMSEDTKLSLYYGILAVETGNPFAEVTLADVIHKHGNTICKKWHENYLVKK